MLARIESRRQYTEALEELRGMGERVATIPKRDLERFEKQRYRLMHDICVYIHTRPREPAISCDPVTAEERFVRTQRCLPRLGGSA